MNAKFVLSKSLEDVCTKFRDDFLYKIFPQRKISGTAHSYYDGVRKLIKYLNINELNEKTLNEMTKLAFAKKIPMDWTARVGGISYIKKGFCKAAMPLFVNYVNLKSNTNISLNTLQLIKSDIKYKSPFDEYVWTSEKSGISIFNNFKQIILPLYPNISKQANSEHSHSNDILKIISNTLRACNWTVETGKKVNEKITLNSGNKLFEPDGLSPDKNCILEVEAGRAVTNYQFLKDFFETLVLNKKYLILLVRKLYRGTKDYEKVKEYFECLDYAKSNLSIKGIMVLGY